MQGAVADCITFVYLPAKYNKSAIPTPHGSWSLRFYCHLAKIPTSQSGRPSKTCFRWQNRTSPDTVVCKLLSQKLANIFLLQTHPTQTIWTLKTDSSPCRRHDFVFSKYNAREHPLSCDCQRPSVQGQGDTMQHQYLNWKGCKVTDSLQSLTAGKPCQATQARSS